MCQFNLILQPAGGHGTGRYSKQHFENTIARSFSLEKIKELDLINEKDYSKLKELYPNGRLHAWAIRSEYSNGNINKSNIDNFRLFKNGDISLFIENRIVKASSKVTYTTINSKLGKYLWDESKYNSSKNEGAPYDLIYFVDEVRFKNIPLRQIGAYLNWNENFALPGWKFVKGNIAETIINDFELNK